MSEKIYEDEISLKELILVLINNWKMVAIFTSIGTLLTIGISYFAMSPVYETKAKLIMNIPESIETEIGSYTYSSTVITDYSDMLRNMQVVESTILDAELDVNVEQFIGDLSLNNEKNSNVVTISFKGSDPEEISSILDIHIDNYEVFLQQKLKTDAIEKFIRSYNVAFKQNEYSYKEVQKRIEESEELLSEMAPVISLKTALSKNSDLAAEFANTRGVSIADLKGSMLQEEILNENYLTIEKLITDNKVTLTNLSIEKEKLEEILEELESEEAALESVEDTEFLSILSSFVQEVSPASTPINPIAPRKALNVAIGFVLSLMLGVFVAFFKAYWQNDTIS